MLLVMSLTTTCSSSVLRLIQSRSRVVCAVACSNQYTDARTLRGVVSEPVEGNVQTHAH